MLNYMGKDSFVWFMGVVEDRQDPLELGRCRVRCLGLHTQNKIDIPTEDLPWATPVQPMTSASMNGIGHTPLGPVEGSWVVGFFRDGANAQDPILIGTVGGVPQVESDVESGFNDPNGKYPKSDFLGEPDVNRLARGITQGTIVDSKLEDAQKLKDIPTANNAQGTWFEPMTPIGATYPYNNVYESESGHIQEFDDTEGAERIHTYHKSGTFEEIHPSGHKVTKVKGEDYEISMGNKFVHIKGNANVLIGDDENASNLTLYVKGNVDMQVNGNVTEKIKGNVEQTVEEGNVAIKSETGNIEINSEGNLKLYSGGEMEISSGGPMRLRGSSIDLN